MVGNRITWEKTGSDLVYYYYDANGKLVALRHNDTMYYYVRNAQGDIYRIVDGSGNLQVQYTYDAWGNIRSISGNMAATLGAANPFRYRGYYFDAEIGFYYLQSRYYNPQWGRFINADSVVGELGSLLSHNVFAYCVNNPVGLSDPLGQDPIHDWWNLLWRVGHQKNTKVVISTSTKLATSDGTTQHDLSTEFNADRILDHKLTSGLAWGIIGLLILPAAEIARKINPNFTEQASKIAAGSVSLLLSIIGSASDTESLIRGQGGGYVVSNGYTLNNITMVVYNNHSAIYASYTYIKDSDGRTTLDKLYIMEIPFQ